MRCELIAEVGMAHDGSLSLAHAYIDAIATTGADCVKFQTHIAEAESTHSEQWRVKPTWCQDVDRYAYWQRTAFTELQWFELKVHAEDEGLEFLSSPFSVEAVELLHRIGVKRWKIASGQVTHTPMLERIAELKQPALVSTGLCTPSELEAAFRLLRYAGPMTMLACVSSYPCLPEQVSFMPMDELRSIYGIPVGLSDHSGTIYPGLLAAWLRAAVVEVHVTLGHGALFLDDCASLTMSELAQLAEGIQFVGDMRVTMPRETRALRDIFCSKKALGWKKGTIA